MVDLVHIPEGGNMQISPKLEVCGAKEVDIRNQRPRLRRNSLILVEKAGGCSLVLVVRALAHHIIFIGMHCIFSSIKLKLLYWNLKSFITNPMTILYK